MLIHIHTHTNTHTRAHIHTYTLLCVWQGHFVCWIKLIARNTYIYTHTHTHTHARTHTHTRTRIHTHKYTLTHVHTQTHPHQRHKQTHIFYTRRIIVWHMWHTMICRVLKMKKIKNKKINVCVTYRTDLYSHVTLKYFYTRYIMGWLRLARSIKL